MKPFLSLCMIVKNEEKVLKRCLDSVQGLVDEIIIVDTGSTDRTKEIALNYVEQVYDFQWIDSFSAARNYASSKAKGKWILVLDADEFVDQQNLQEIILELKTEKQPADAYAVLIYNFVGAFGEKIVQHRHSRIYRNEPDIYFIRDIHEQLIKEDGELDIRYSNLNIYHSGYISETIKEKDKYNRNAPLLESEMNKEIDNAYDYFNLGNEFLSKKNPEKALDAYMKAFQLKSSIQLRWIPFTVIQIIICLMELNREEEALKVINDGEQMWPNSPEFVCLRAKIYLSQNRLQDAKLELENMVQNKDHFREFIKSIDFLESYPHHMMGEIYENQSDFQNAVIQYTKAISFNNRDFDSVYKLIGILLDRENEQEVLNFIDRTFGNKAPIVQYMVLNILLSHGNVFITEGLLSRWSSLTIWRGIHVKLAILKHKYEDAKEIALIKPIQELLNDGWVDIFDLILIGLNLESQNFLEIIKEHNTEYSSFISLLINDTELWENEDVFIQLLRKCIQMKKNETMNALLKHREKYSTHLKIKLANLFFFYKCFDLAFAFYQDVPEFEQYDDIAFVNIIKALTQKGNYEEALQLVITAIQNDIKDFRIYEYGLELLESSNNKILRSEILQLALYLYPGSRWLLEQSK